MDDDDLVRLTITDVRVAVPAGNGIEAGLVVLEEVPEPHRRLRMYVGQPEARAIHLSWSQAVADRPSTWDLFVSTISVLDARIERVVVSDVQEERHYFAQMVLRRAEVDEPLVLPARPSDAIALALRAYGAKILARPHVLDAAGILADGSHWVRPQPDPEPEPVPATDPPDDGTAPAGSAEPAPLGGAPPAGERDLGAAAAGRATAADAARSFRSRRSGPTGSSAA